MGPRAPETQEEQRPRLRGRGSGQGFSTEVVRGHLSPVMIKRVGC